MGSGLLTLSFRTNQLMELFEEDRELAFADAPEEMQDVALRFKRDDARRRRSRRRDGGSRMTISRAPGRALHRGGHVPAAAFQRL